MNKKTFEVQLDAQVICGLEQVSAELTDGRPETIGLFVNLDEVQREQLAMDAWSIGLRALANAHAQAQEARLQDIGRALINDIDQQLDIHANQQAQTISEVLSRYFDPNKGHLQQRLKDFIDDQGVLARILEKYLAPQNSVLAETFAQQIGEQSILFKKLSPTDSEGLIKTLETQLCRVMAQSHQSITQALDPLIEDSAVARFLRSLSANLKQVEVNRSEQFAVALSALDTKDEQSLINRLFRDIQLARQELLHAINPENPGSSMALIKESLVTLLKTQASAQEVLMQEQQQRQQALEKEIREALIRLETRQQHSQRSTTGGRDFEQDVIDLITDTVRGAPCTVNFTGNTAGLQGRRKVGDVVVRFTEESAFVGTGVVFEAKHDSSYTTQRALDELNLARNNRDALAGVFIMARSHAPAGFPQFARFGNNVLVTWDHQDSTTDAYLQAAVMLGLALVTRRKPLGDAGDINALHDIEQRIETELGRIERMEKNNDAIRKNADQISDELRKGRKHFERLLDKAKETLRALNVELSDESLESKSPIRFRALQSGEILDEPL